FNPPLASQEENPMKAVIPNDLICTKTVALIPAREIGYDTIIMKENETKYVRETALNLIKLACYYYDFTTYEVRRDGVIFYTNFVKKTPMPISIHRGIYLFPTHSPHHIDNCWIAFHHVLSIKKVPKHQATQKAQSI